MPHNSRIISAISKDNLSANRGKIYLFKFPNNRIGKKSQAWISNFFQFENPNSSN